MTRKYNSDYDVVETQTESSMLKTVIIGAIGTIASYYVTMWAKRMLEEKPLKTRVREGKEYAAQMKESAMMKAERLKANARMKADQAAVKARSLVEEKEMQANDLIDDTSYSKTTTVVKNDSRGSE